MNNMPFKDVLAVNARKVLDRAVPEGGCVRGVTEFGEYWLVAIPLEDASNPPVCGPARLGTMAHFGLGDLDD